MRLVFVQLILSLVVAAAGPGTAMASTSAVPGPCLGACEEIRTEIGPANRPATCPTMLAMAIDPAWLGGFGLGRIFPSDRQPEDSGHSVTFTKASKEQTRRSGSHVILRRQAGQGWFSDAGPFENALQGDPRLPFMVLGRELATFLGFQMWDKDTIVFPTVRYLNQRIKMLNQWLKAEGKREIGYTFYVQGADTERGYRGRLFRLSLPVSGDSLEVAAHDLVFHVPQILEDPAISHRMGRINKFLGVYLKYAATKVAAAELQAENEDVNTILDELAAQVSVNIYRVAVFLPEEAEDGRQGLSERAEERTEERTVLLETLTTFQPSRFMRLKYWSEFTAAHDRQLERFEEDMYSMEGADMTPSEHLLGLLLRRREITAVLRKNR